MTALNGKHIVVTGASAGIGALTCRELGKRRVRVTLAARRQGLLHSVAEQVRQAGGEAQVVEFDAVKREATFKLAAVARQQFGEIDIWVSNAGAGMRHNLLEASEEDMLRLFRLNALSSLWAYQAVIMPWLTTGRAGQVMDVCSLGGKSGYAFNGGYSAAKHAMSALGDTMRQELLGKGIHVTTVYPGPTVSDFGKAATDKAGGKTHMQVEELRKHKSWLVRKVSGKQSTEAVVRSMIRAMEHPVPVVYPHRWGNFAVLMSNLFPRFMLKRLERNAV